MIYDKDANTFNLCLGCKYNVENPSEAFNPAPVEEEMPAKPVKKGVKSKTAKKVVKVKPVIYTGSKVIEAPATTTGVAPQPQTQTTNQ